MIVRLCGGEVMDDGSVVVSFVWPEAWGRMTLGQHVLVEKISFANGSIAVGDMLPVSPKGTGDGA